ncbi:MAG: hypothetical protein HY258_13700 [Chloroflexi bacterium]|nr:hypothetical protein [Chloroflexota bacterium]
MMQPSLFQRFLRRLNKEFASFFFLDQWVIMTAQGADYDSLDWSAFHPLIPEKDRYWADPFIIQKENQYYIFIEEKIYATGMGHIACLTLDEKGKLLLNQVVLERPYHLSYPFLFEHHNEMYMIPETAGNRTIELYRCVHFPDQWEFVKNLMTDIYAVDATLLKYDKKFWLFANVKTEGGSSLNALHLFFADDLLSSKWTPHPRNPVMRDLRSARPGGKIFQRDGKLIRPSQDSSRRYGYALKFNRIVKLSETEYEEVTESTFAPRGGKILATHTFNQAGELTVIDAIIRRKK